MVASAVLGAATGTGLALLVAMTLVVYRYYASRRYGKDWGDVERFKPGYQHESWSSAKGRTGSTAGTRQSSTSSKRSQRAHSIAVTNQQTFNVAKEEAAVQPSSPGPLESVAPALDITGGLQATLCRTPSLSSHASLDSNISRQSVGGGRSCRNLSPECRTEGVHRPRPLSPLLVPQDSTSSLGSSRDVPSSPLPLGTLQPSLYARQEGPLNIRAENSVGRLRVSLSYDFDRSDLRLHLIQGEDIAGGEFSEPYVRVSLEPPVDQRVRQTGAQARGSPFFDHHFKFPISHDDLHGHVLLLQVYDYDRYSRNDIIGELRIDLGDIDITTNVVEIWGDIAKTRRPREELQEILVSLSYLPSAERLTVVLLKAKNLYLPETRDSIDPFVKVYLQIGGKRVKKKKTACKKACSNPVWNEAITFNVTAASLNSTAVEVCVMDQGSDLIGGPSLVGSVLIGQAEGGPGNSHWLEMIASPRKAVAMWHALR